MKTPEFTAHFSLGTSSNLQIPYRTFNRSIFTGVKDMDQSENTNQLGDQPQNEGQDSVLIPQQTSESNFQAPTQAADLMSPPFIYAIGQIEGRFPSLGIEKEFAQAAAQTDTAGLTNQQTLHK